MTPPRVTLMAGFLRVLPSRRFPAIGFVLCVGLVRRTSPRWTSCSGVCGGRVLSPVATPFLRQHRLAPDGVATAATRPRAVAAARLRSAYGAHARTAARRSRGD